MAEQKSAAEVAQERSDALAEQYKSEGEEAQKAALDARENQPDVVETDEEYYDRRRAAIASGIFGDTDTTAGTGASEVDVPSADNEGAGVAVSERDAQAEGGDEEAADLSGGEARRQVDVESGAPSAADVEEGATAEEEEGGW